ncbi:hypothetical protein HK105_201019 [Polyrhizophydium stewartii]|uniref:Ankyrin repeat protein n=1 Tax=Polyrhizophydium stewartii TaxID=2732419 RepID=A0ABR4NIM3_9FUNG
MGQKKRPSAHRTPNAGPATAAPHAAAAAPPAADPPAAVTAALSGDSLQLAVVALSAGLESLRGDLAAQHTAQSTLAAANRALQADNQALAARVQALEAELFRLRCAFDSRQPLLAATPAPPPPAAAPRRAKIKMPPPMAVNAGARNQWDRMPEPVRSRILACSSVLTRFTNGLLMPVELRPLSHDEIHVVWDEVFETRWIGDFAKLPPMCLKPESHSLIKSREQFIRIPPSLFPDGTSRISVILRNGWVDDLAGGGHADDMAYAAACAGFIPILESFIAKMKIIEVRLDLAEAAAAFGHLNVIQFLHAHAPRGQKWNTSVMANAAASGSLNIVIWLHKNRKEVFAPTVFEAAASNGHIHVIEWLSKNTKADCTQEAINSAASKGHLEILKFLVKRYPNVAIWLRRISMPILSHLPVAKWAHENNYSMDFFAALDNFIILGDLEGVEWVVKTFDVRPVTEMLFLSCLHSRDRVANWLVNVKGVQITSNIVKEAVERSATSVLSVLIRKDRKWRDVAKRFAQSNNREILNWLAARHPA